MNLLIYFRRGLFCLLFVCCAVPGTWADWEAIANEQPATELSSRPALVRAPLQPSAAGTLTTTNETEATPEILDLARALDHDPLLIFNYVRNRIDFVPTYGIRNGAHGCLLAGRGNDWDKAALLSSLLRVSGYKTRFVKAPVFYVKEDLANWLGVETNLLSVIVPTMGNHAFTMTDNSYVFGLVRIWVEAEIAGVFYPFDPSYVSYREYYPINLAEAMRYDPAEFLDQALAGAAVTSDFVQYANVSNINRQLATYTTNLIAFIRTWHPDAPVEQLIENREAVEENAAEYPTALPDAFYVHTASFYDEWDHIPASNNLTIYIQHAGLDKTFKGYELAGKRLSLSYDEPSGFQSQLWLDDAVAAWGPATAEGSRHPLQITVDHAYYDEGFADKTYIIQLTSGSRYTIVHDFESISPRIVTDHQQQLSKAVAQGDSALSAAVFTRAMQATVDNGLLQSHLASRRFARLAHTLTFLHNFIGIMGQNPGETGGYFVDLPGINVSTLAVDATESESVFKARSFFDSALEHGMLEQSQGTNRQALSTIKLLDLSNRYGARVYRAASNNWSLVRPQLINYSAALLEEIQDNIDLGYMYILPQNADITLNDWTGIGYVRFIRRAAGSMTQSMIISGDYNGGYNSEPGLLDPLNIFKKLTGFDNLLIDPYLHPTTSKEPVDLATGQYLFQRTDLSVGDPEPRGFHFKRYYHSGLQWQDGPLGYGWTHNYDIRARPLSQPEPSLGERRPIDAAAYLVRSLVVLDLMKNESDLRAWFCGILTTKWVMDQLTENVVQVQTDNKLMEYIRLPNGTYLPPPGCRDNLERTNGLYVQRSLYDRVLAFNSNQLASSLTDPWGNQMQFAYDGSNRLQTVRDAYGRTLSFTWNAAGQIDAVRDDASARTTRYQYLDGHLASFSDAEDQAWTYRYKPESHLLTEMIDPLNHALVSNVYNNVDKVVEQVDADGHRWKIFSCASQGIEEDPLGAQSIYLFDQSGRPKAAVDALGNIAIRLYDAENHIKALLDPMDNLTMFLYDERGNNTCVIDPDNHATFYAYDERNRVVAVTNALGHAILFQYDARHSLTNIVDTLGHSAPMAYYPNGLLKCRENERGFTTRWAYDAFGRLQTLTDPNGSTASNDWNACGDLIAIADPAGQVTRMTYNKNRQLTTVADPSGYTASNRYNAAGLRIAASDRKGNTAAYTYTPSYRVQTITFPDGSCISNTYNAAGKLSAVKDERGHVAAYAYDPAGRLIAFTDPLGITTTNAYDGNGRCIAFTDGTGNTYSNRYDALGRMAAIVDPLQQVMQFQYDALGSLTGLVDEAGTRIEYAYDALGRRISSQLPDGSRERMEYDPAGNLTAFVNANGKEQCLTYDALNHLSAYTNALGQSAAYVRNPMGLLTASTDAQGRTRHFFYDANNRISRITHSDGSSISFEYDANSNVRQTHDGVGVTEYTYDALDRLIQAVDHHGLSIRYAWDSCDNRTNVVYPDGRQVAYTYDDANRPETVRLWNNQVFRYAYDADGNLRSIEFPNGAMAAYHVDGKGFVDRFSHAAHGSNFISRVIQRNALGHKMTEEVLAGLLPQAPPLEEKVYTMNAADQPAHASVRSSPTVWQDVRFTHDPCGNRSAEMAPAATQACQWDFDNRLIRYADGNQTRQYAYDATGHRTGLSVDGVMRYQALDRQGALPNVLLTADAAGTPLEYFIWGANGLLARMDASGATRYVHADEAGSTLALTDENGRVTDEIAYSPYGEILARIGATPMPYLFVGGYGVYSETTNLYHMKARYYDAHSGRFLSADPMSLRGGANAYAYAEGNPLAFIDPLGLEAFNPIGQFINDGMQAIATAGEAFESAASMAKMVYDAIPENYGIDVSYNKVLEKFPVSITVLDQDIEAGIGGGISVLLTKNSVTVTPGLGMVAGESWFVSGGQIRSSNSKPGGWGRTIYAQSAMTQKMPVPLSDGFGKFINQKASFKNLGVSISDTMTQDANFNGLSYGVGYGTSAGFKLTYSIGTSNWKQRVEEVQELPGWYVDTAKSIVSDYGSKLDESPVLVVTPYSLLPMPTQPLKR